MLEACSIISICMFRICFFLCLRLLQIGNDTSENEVDDQSRSAHFDVQQQLIVDSSGIRVQIMRVIKLGHSNEPMDLSEHLSNLFNSLTDLSFGFDDSKNPYPDGALKTNKDRFTDDFDDSSDQFWMKLVDDNENESNDDEDGDNGNSIHGHHRHDDSETTTTVMKVSHKLKVPTKEKINYPPHSVFAKLAPSKDRYTILRDEL